MVNKIV
jgi:dynein intermediate chain 3, axonemal